MNVPTIEMDPEAAAEKADEYHRAFEKSGNEEDADLAKGFDALTEGKRIISLLRVFDVCPADNKGRPRLAIARADRRQVNWSGSEFHADRWSRGAKPKHAMIPIRWRISGSSSGYADLPVIPPDIRGGRNLAKHFVLWEVEQWAEFSSGVQPDRDPYLLRRVNSGLDLFVVVAEWNVTELERAYVAERGRVA